MAEEQNNQGGEGQGSAGAGGTNEKPARPEYLPEKFWDGEKGEPRIEGLAKSYGDLEKKLTGGKGLEALTAEITEGVKKTIDTERTKARPAKAEDYKLSIPEGALPEGLDFKFDEANPLVAWWRNACYEQGHGQDKFDEGVKLFIEGEVSKLTASSAALEGEFKKLGEHAKARIDFLAGRIGEIAGPSAEEALAPFLKTAASVEAIEKIIEATGGPKFSAIHKAENSEGALTLEQLKDMQKDPKYQTDAALRQKVSEGYRKLYPGEHKGGFAAA